MSLDSQQIQNYIDQLSWYDGYKRQEALEQLENCFDPQLFPHLLKKLSDYVPNNRILASQHLLKWSEKAECADLCVAYFLDLQAIQKRIRVVNEVEIILFEKLNNNIEKIKDTLQLKQGQLSRELYKYLENNHILSEQELLSIAQNSKDQYIRKNWINFILQQDIAYIKSQFLKEKNADVQKEILNFLLAKQDFDRTVWIQAFSRQYLSIIDISSFVLKKINFDFTQYFKERCKENLTQQQVKLHLKQMILIKWDKLAFISLARSVEEKNILFSLLLKAWKEDYLTIKEIVYLFDSKNIKLPYHLLSKFILVKEINLDEIESLYHLSCEEINFDTRLEIYSYLSFWDKFDWLTRIWIYAQSKEDLNSLQDLVEIILKEVKYQYYAPMWTSAYKNECCIKFDTICYKCNFSEQYLQECIRIRKFLQQ